MLNIGKLGSGAAEYYIGEVASAAEDYYTGQGEAKGRWVGSLRETLSLEGEVDPEHFRRVLNGEHPHTGERLLPAQGLARRAAARRSGSPPELLDQVIDSARAAAYLGVSHQYVRRLLKAGAEYRSALQEAGPDDVVQEPRRYLSGELVPAAGQTGGGAWRIPRLEVERLAGERTPTKPRPGYDVTLRPPKSVSALWALAEPEVRAEIRRAHAESVDEVVGYLESWAVRARLSGKDGRFLQETDGVIAAAFDHRTSRAGDPLLHTHVVVANMTRVESEHGPVWRAIAGYGLFEHAKAAGHLYQAHLRHLLTARLGVEWGSISNGYADIAGVPPEVVEVFSKRRTEIAEVLAESGNSSARAAQIATLETRKPKGYQVDANSLFDHWRTEASTVGFTPAEAAKSLHRVAPELVTEAAIADAFDDLAGPTGLTERASIVSRSDVVEELASRFVAALPASEIESLTDRFLASDSCVVVDQATPRPTAEVEADRRPVRASRRASTQRAYTTKDLAELELELLQWAGDVHGRISTAIHEETMAAVLADRPELSLEQVAMVRAVCGSDEPVMPVAGRPGAGKTYATEAIVAAHAGAGVPIIGCAVSATAAAELERAAGFSRSAMAATTVAKLLMDLDRWGGLAPGSVVVVDEASMLATRDLHRLVAHARRADGSVVLVGDPDQHGPVDVGGVFQRLCRDRGEGLLRLVENNRQASLTDRMAIAEYREGHVSDALSRLDNADQVVRSATAGESFDAMVADWYADHLEGGADPMIAGPNSTRQALNDRARMLMIANGELTGDPIVVGGREYLVGDLVVARRNDRRLRTNRDAEFVKNGSVGQVAVIHPGDREVTVEFEREGTIRIPHSYLAAGRLEHGYARTSYGVQGATHGTARYHPTDLSSFEEGYVAITRGRDASRVYIVDGTIAPNDEEAHQAPEAQRFDLDDIASALARRRTGAMAADIADRLPIVHQLARLHTLGHLAIAQRRLERILATAPADPTRAIEAATVELDGLRTRRNLHAQRPRPDSRIKHIDRAVVQVERRLHAAHRQQAERENWLDQHSDVVDRYDLVTRAMRHRRARISDNPRLYLSDEIAEQAGGKPIRQGERRVWKTRLVERALQHDSGLKQDPMAAPPPNSPELE